MITHHTPYAYVRNNPLKYTDPSGHSFLGDLWDKVKDVVIGVVVAIVAVYTAGAVLGALGYSASAASAAGYANAFAYASASGAAGTAALMASGAAAGFAAGVTGTLLNGGTLSQALQAGAQGALFGAIGAGVANVIGSIPLGGNLGKTVRASLHGITRAAISKAQGGRWSAGFWSGFAGSALSPLTSYVDPKYKIAVQAIVGGTAAELGGGKFANGAVTAAFVMMYNHMAHQVPGHRLHEPSDNFWQGFKKGTSDLIDGIFSLPKALYSYGDYLARITGFRDWQSGNTLPWNQWEAELEYKALMYGLENHKADILSGLWQDMTSRPNYYIGGALIGSGLGYMNSVAGKIYTAGSLSIKPASGAIDYIHTEINPLH